ncbi:helix-turn-helix transcriptional regulator [Nodularia sp. UHCC 0506]|uniref:helix-turn-helix domain-containing protein n=1 Tax=Nodularia sp. UHCC 0506 TaxID=3110243 RepID=UPI002B202F6B|nr:helix-turn-helix transcriptional regulator [Nodularia sp. UHCC 0506]MEA5513499.1 helix-turn-helix transcriptional regulator [Nodularia sp. UHCC 0506]
MTEPDRLPSMEKNQLGFPTEATYQKTIFRCEYIQLLKILKSIREKQGLSQAELGMLVGQDQTFVSKYENCVRRLDIIETLDICRALEISIHDIIEELNQE